jgi:transcriptional regulator of acetoin/glycerol metabolism
MGGAIERAKGGTLFLNDLLSIPRALQSQLSAYLSDGAAAQHAMRSMSASGKGAALPRLSKTPTARRTLTARNYSRQLDDLARCGHDGLAQIWQAIRFSWSLTTRRH